MNIPRLSRNALLGSFLLWERKITLSPSFTLRALYCLYRYASPEHTEKKRYYPLKQEVNFTYNEKIVMKKQGILLIMSKLVLEELYYIQIHIKE